jgi:hypothetical protein
MMSVKVVTILRPLELWKLLVFANCFDAKLMTRFDGWLYQHLSLDLGFKALSHVYVLRTISEIYHDKEIVS